MFTRGIEDKGYKSSMVRNERQATSGKTNSKSWPSLPGIGGLSIRRSRECYDEEKEPTAFNGSEMISLMHGSTISLREVW